MRKHCSHCLFRNLLILTAVLAAATLPAPVHAAAASFQAGSFPALTSGGNLIDSAAVDAVVADFNGDGFPDVFIVMGRTQTLATDLAHADRLYLGDGNGGFTLEAGGFDAALPRVGSSAVAADFNRDGRQDIVVAGASLYQGAVSGVRVEPTVVYANLQGGGFSSGQALSFLAPVVQIAAADIDADGATDLLLRQSDGLLRVFRNTGAVGAALALSEVQSFAVGSSDIRNRFAVGRLAGNDSAPDIAVLRPTSGQAPAGVVVLRNVGGAQPFQIDTSVALNAPLADIAVGDFNRDGRDDIVVVADTEDTPPVWSRTRILWNRASGFEVGEERFPGNGLRRVAVGDVDNDGSQDFVFGRSREIGSLTRDVPSLLVVLNRSSGFVASSQCMGRYAGVPTAIRIAALDADPWPDLLVMGATPQFAPQSSPGWWRNNAPGITAACCMAQLAAQHVESQPLPSGAPALRSLLTTMASSAVDIRTYSAVRDGILSNALNGARLRQRYEQFGPEIVTRMMIEPALWRDVATTLTLWSDPLARLLAGNGASRTVSAQMIEAVDNTLLSLASGGSPALAQAITDERSLLPPLQSLVGLDMNGFRALVAPPDTLFADRFEVATP